MSSHPDGEMEEDIVEEESPQKAQKKKTDDSSQKPEKSYFQEQEEIRKKEELEAEFREACREGTKGGPAAQVRQVRQPVVMPRRVQPVEEEEGEVTYVTLLSRRRLKNRT